MRNAATRRLTVDASRTTARVGPGGCPDHRLEITDEMGLVTVAEAHRQCRLVHVAGAELFGRLVQTVALDHPLRADTDVLREEALQCSPAHSGARHQVIDLYN